MGARIYKSIILGAVFGTFLAVQETPYAGTLGGGLFETKSGVPIVIYGSRGPCDASEAPDFGEIMDHPEAISRAPKHGKLSDGGAGSRRIGSCGGRVVVRKIVYTPNPGFVGIDIVEFFGSDIATIEVLPAD